MLNNHHRTDLFSNQMAIPMAGLRLGVLGIVIFAWFLSKNPTGSVLYNILKIYGFKEQRFDYLMTIY